MQNKYESRDLSLIPHADTKTFWFRLSYKSSQGLNFLMYKRGVN